MKFDVNAQFVWNMVPHWEEEFVRWVMNSMTKFTNSRQNVTFCCVQAKKNVSEPPRNVSSGRNSATFWFILARAKMFWSVGSVFHHVSRWSQTSWLIVAGEHKPWVWTVTPPRPPFCPRAECGGGMRAANPNLPQKLHLFL